MLITLETETCTKYRLEYRCFDNHHLLFLQLYTAAGQYWLHKTEASHEHWQFKTNKIIYENCM